MIRFLLFLIVVALAGLLGNWLMEHDGMFTLTWFGYRIDTTSTVALAALALFTIAVSGLLFLLSWIKNIPSRVAGSHHHKKRELGLLSLTEGFAAVAAGDEKKALKLAKKAENALGKTPLTLLLHTQTAQLQGNDTSAKLYLTSMAQHKETEIIALKGLLLAARKEGDTKEALALAERAYTLKPDAPWITPLLVDLYKLTGQWDKAQAVLEDALRHKRLDTEQGRHDLGILLLANGKKLFDIGQIDASYHYLKHARNYLPLFAPLTVQWCLVLKAMGKERKALDTLAKHWKLSPHPSLSSCYLGFFAEEKPQKRLKRIESLAAKNPDHYESRVAVARAAITAADYPVARQQLEKLLAAHETVDACLLMAEVEKCEGNTAAHQEWLVKMPAAAQSPAWVCHHCHFSNANWDVQCPNCHTFDSYRWQEGQAAYAMA